jgi:hypothetical protein
VSSKDAFQGGNMGCCDVEVSLKELCYVKIKDCDSKV